MTIEQMKFQKINIMTIFYCTWETIEIRNVCLPVYDTVDIS